ncbi:hypothetical protein HPB50_007349 [Hyalomma asiaticum]|uniref:Uncharacterized protein n=1 Tax=Hyalomma asiaticum TaxID=266040 RepID=A0ACB7SSQ7_HYAAI|nr:hypothetical protein HPB50_007349 [Hyalomma asiaticum]
MPASGGCRQLDDVVQAASQRGHSDVKLLVQPLLESCRAGLRKIQEVRECNHVPHDLVEGNLDLGTELMAFDPPAMITFKDPLAMKPALNGSNGTILGLTSQPKGLVPSPS